jgi:uncharacterized protein YndB with AHSA1/START domain
LAAIVHSIDISRPPEEVFALLNDVERLGEWQDDVMNVRRHDEGPPRVGTRVTQTRRLGKRELTTTTEVTEYDPPRSYAFRGVDGPIRPILRGTVEPLEGGRSRVTVRLDFDGRGPAKLILPLVRRQAGKTLVQQHERLKELLEQS